MRVSLALIVVLLFGSLLIADEGMWMPHQMKMLDLEREGLKMDPGELYKPDGTGLMSAVVDLGGGTGSFVSEKGLIFTNHHVAYGAIQRASTPEDNYLEEGFLAENYAEEILAPGYTAGVLLSYDDVTEAIITTVHDKMSAMERYKAIDKAKKDLIAQAESEAEDRFAEIASMYSGNKYYLFKYKKIKDVRIVYAPPGALGNFGGEVDNWMWPRHTCDFTFLRAYVSPEGLGVEYNEKNVPYEPKVHFKISMEGVREKDFVFIMGYPGRTYRNNSTPEVLYDVEKIQKSLAERQEYIRFFENAGKENKDVEIKYASKVKGLYNGLKNYQGKLEGFDKIDLIGKKQVQDATFEKWIQEKRSRKKEYGGVVEKIDEFLNQEYKPFSEKEASLSEMTSYYYGPALVAKAHNLVRLSLEGQKPDEERDAFYMERNISNIRRMLQFAERSYDKNIDKNFAQFVMNRFLGKNKENLPGFVKDILARGPVNEWIEEAYAQTKLGDTEYTLSLVGKTPRELKDLRDPLINFAFDMEEELAELREQKHEMDQKLLDLKKIYQKALLEMNNDRIAPDANSTVRFTSGHVMGYYPKDGVYFEPKTTLKGLIEKDTGTEPFQTPAKIKELYKAQKFSPYTDEETDIVPACFLSTTNVTGGNSGSPTLNARGEVVGIVFDMTYESVTGDYYIVPELQRVISADIKYVLFVTDHFSEADYLLKEMNVK
ncbi:MAG: S46 family peptidase [Candidatus Marinimicrobia bacterium]|nr:S46 family peptidase [Candidatus Neomarinimicrobiota bacterium]